LSSCSLCRCSFSCVSNRFVMSRCCVWSLVSCSCSLLLRLIDLCLELAIVPVRSSERPSVLCTRFQTTIDVMDRPLSIVRGDTVCPSTHLNTQPRRVVCVLLLLLCLCHPQHILLSRKAKISQFLLLLVSFVTAAMLTTLCKTPAVIAFKPIKQP
jgi:hypothetical protein